MPLQPNSQYLVDQLQALQILDGRFEELQLVNIDSVTNEQRGCFSLVFKARDRDSGNFVALKFFDPQAIGNAYRQAAFQREHEILKLLLGASNCLQLASGFNTYSLQINTVGGLTLALPCCYFAIEWIEDDIDEYFFRQQAFSAVERLELFLDITRAVSALHVRRVFHRDLKYDNIRAEVRNRSRLVLPIDLGTAARFESNPINTSYAVQVGALGYASPEAQCGLAGNRLIAKFTDFYALGCMLFELFNQDFFFHEIRKRNGQYDFILAALRSAIDASADEPAQLEAWNKNMNKMAAAIIPIGIDGPGSDVPPGVSSLLNEVVRSLTHIDLRNRPQALDWVSARIRSAIKVLLNERAYQKRIAHAKETRRMRVVRAQQREARVERHLAKAKEVTC